MLNYVVITFVFLVTDRLKISITGDGLTKISREIPPAKLSEEEKTESMYVALLDGKKKGISLFFKLLHFFGKKRCFFFSSCDGNPLHGVVQVNDSLNTCERLLPLHDDHDLCACATVVKKLDKSVGEVLSQL